MTIANGVGPATGDEGGGSTAVATLVGTTVGRSIIANVRWTGTTRTISGITVSGESDMTVHGSPTTSTSVNMSHQWASLSNNTAGGDKTITLTLSGTGSAQIWVQELLGTNTAGVFDAETGGTGNGANPSVNLTTVADNCHILASITNDNSDATAGTGFTILGLSNLFWFDEIEQLTSFDAGVAGVNAAGFTVGSGNWLIKTASFKPAPASGGGADPIGPANIAQSAGRFLGWTV